MERYGITQHPIVTSFDPFGLKIGQRIAPLQQCGFIAKYSNRSDLGRAVGLGCVQANIPLKTSPGAMVEAPQSSVEAMD